MNRLLHWYEIRHYKQAGIPIYDFGGIVLDPSHPLHGIGMFKRSFGGELVVEDIVRLARNPLLRAALRAASRFGGAARKLEFLVARGRRGSCRPTENAPGSPDSTANRSAAALETVAAGAGSSSARAGASVIRRTLARLKAKTARTVFEPEGVDTYGVTYLDEFGLAAPERTEYRASGWFWPIRGLWGAPITSDDVFVDFGAGKGRVVYTVARRYGFGRIIGVEISPELTAIGMLNLERVRHKLRCKNVEIVTCDAVAFRVPDDATYAYFYNPFNGATFERVLENIVESLDRRSRPLPADLRQPEHEARRPSCLRSSRPCQRSLPARAALTRHAAREPHLGLRRPLIPQRPRRLRPSQPASVRGSRPSSGASSSALSQAPMMRSQPKWSRAYAPAAVSEGVRRERQALGDRRRKRLRIGPACDQPRLERSKQLGCRAHGRADNRRSARQRFDRHHPEALVRDRRQDEEIGCPVPVRELAVADLAEEEDSFLQPELAREGAQATVERAAADDVQAGAGGVEHGHGAEKVLESHARLQPPHGQEQRRLLAARPVVHAQPARRRPARSRPGSFPRARPGSWRPRPGSPRGEPSGCIR